MVLSITPDSFISSQRSFPSRERSPTPTKAERPECSSAMLRISSWISTVLPTPAPPNSPTLPPLAYGASRSMTLIPVSRISCVGVRSEALGAGRWIGQRSSVCTSGPLSIGSPSRLKMRPRVASPTGTVIGPPVSVTTAPREIPSVASIATARTRSSPRCCCTSQTRTADSPSLSPPLVSIVTAEKISGSLSGKTASMTTPVTCSTRPWLVPLVPLLSAMGSFSDHRIEVAFGCQGRLAERLGAADDLQDLLRDFGLTGAVHLQRQVADHGLGVLRRVAHRRHPRPELRG